MAQQWSRFGKCLGPWVGAIEWVMFVPSPTPLYRPTSDRALLYASMLHALVDPCVHVPGF